MMGRYSLEVLEIVEEKTNAYYRRGCRVNSPAVIGGFKTSIPPDVYIIKRPASMHFPSYACWAFGTLSNLLASPRDNGLGDTTPGLEEATIGDEIVARRYADSVFCSKSPGVAFA